MARRGFNKKNLCHSPVVLEILVDLTRKYRLYPSPQPSPRGERGRGVRNFNVSWCPEGHECFINNKLKNFIIK